MSDFDPDVSLRTLRAITRNYNRRGAEPQYNAVTSLATMVAVFNAIDIHLSTGGILPTEWHKDGHRAQEK